MKATAICYTSNTGHTKRYAEMLGNLIKLPVYELKQAKQLPKGTDIIYMGWLFASSVKGYRKACKRFNIKAVAAVGLCDTGAMLTQVRKAIALDDTVPLFTVQGGMDYSRLRGINKFMIDMLRKMLSSKDRTEEEERMFELVQNGGEFVSEENLSAVLKWYNEE